MRRTTNYYIVRFNDLSKEKQEEIRNDLLKRISEDTEMIEYLTEAQKRDPDIKIEEHVSGAVERGCQESWAEWGVSSTL